MDASGDHAGPSSRTSLCVICTGLVPSASMTQISMSRSGLPPPTSASLSKAIRPPSRDHAGAESKAPGTSNSVVSPLPSAAVAWIARSLSPIGLGVVLRVLGELPQAAPVGVHREDVARRRRLLRGAEARER